MNYTKPELMIVGSANNLVAGFVPKDSQPGRLLRQDIAVGYDVTADEEAW